MTAITRAVRDAGIALDDIDYLLTVQDKTVEYEKNRKH